MNFTEYWLAATAACFVLSMGQFFLMEFEWFSHLTDNSIINEISVWSMGVSGIAGVILSILTPFVIYYR